MEVLDEELGGSNRSVKGSSPPLVRVLFFPLPIFVSFLPLWKKKRRDRVGYSLSQNVDCYSPRLLLYVLPSIWMTHLSHLILTLTHHIRKHLGY